MRLFTVGHSNVEMDRFLALLRSTAIEAVADVRSVPFSRIAPHFSRAPLARALATHSIQYIYEGGALGGRPNGTEFYESDGRVLYGRLATAPWFIAGLQRISSVGEGRRLAILCSEESPLGCHRHRLISRILTEQGNEVIHLRGDGSLQPYEATTDVRERRRSEPTLFSVGADEAWTSLRSVSRSDQPQTSSTH